MLAAWARGGLQAPRPHGSPGASPSSGWGTRCPLPRRECEPRAPARQSAPRPPDKYPPFRQQRAAQPSQCLLVDRNLPMKRTRNTERASGPRAPSGPRPQLSLWPPAPRCLPAHPGSSLGSFRGADSGGRVLLLMLNGVQRGRLPPRPSSVVLRGHLRPRCGRGGPAPPVEGPLSPPPEGVCGRGRQLAESRACVGCERFGSVQ